MATRLDKGACERNQVFPHVAVEFCYLLYILDHSP